MQSKPSPAGVRPRPPNAMPVFCPVSSILFSNPPFTHHPFSLLPPFLPPLPCLLLPLSFLIFLLIFPYPFSILPSRIDTIDSTLAFSIFQENIANNIAPATKGTTQNIVLYALVSSLRHTIGQSTYTLIRSEATQDFTADAEPRSIALAVRRCRGGPSSILRPLSVICQPCLPPSLPSSARHPACHTRPCEVAATIR